MPIFLRAPAHSTLNKILEYFSTETISSLHQKIYLRHLQPILLHFSPRESFLKQTVRMLREECILISALHSRDGICFNVTLLMPSMEQTNPYIVCVCLQRWKYHCCFFPVKGSSIERIR